MDKLSADGTKDVAVSEVSVEDSFLDFEIEDVTELDIFAPTIHLCSSTCSSSF